MLSYTVHLKPLLTSVAGSTFNEDHQWAIARKVSPDQDVHSWALGEVDVLGPAVWEKAIDAGTATKSHQQLDCALDL